MNPVGALVFILDYAFDIYIMIVLARFILQIVRADFYNPISQFIVKATTPVLKPLRRLIPGFGGIDVASIVLMLSLVVAKILIIQLIYVGSLTGVSVIGLGLLTLKTALGTLLSFYMVCIFGSIIMSWIAQGSHSPIAALLHQITDPVMAPARKILPPMGGLDLSPMIVIALIMTIRVFLGLT